MKQQLNEIKRMQQLAGLLAEDTAIDDNTLKDNINKLSDQELQEISFVVRHNFEDVDEDKLLDGLLYIIEKVNPAADLEKKKMSLQRDMGSMNDTLYTATQKSFSASRGLKDYFEDNLQIFK